MAKNLPASPKSAGTVYRVACNDPRLKIIGLDTDDDASHSLYDERINVITLVEPDEDGKAVLTPFAKSILSRGIVSPIVCTVEGGQWLVVDGRQRLRAARLIQERTGKPMSVPVMAQNIKGLNDEDRDLTIMLNEARTDDDPVTRAEKVTRFVKSGVTKDNCCDIFSVSMPSLNRLIRFIEGSPTTDAAGDKLKSAVRMGYIPWTRALGFLAKQADGSRMPPEDVEALAAKALDEAGWSPELGRPAGSKVTNVGGRGRNSGGRASFVKHSQIKKYMTKAPEAFSALPDEIRATIEWIMNPEGTDLPEDHPLVSWQVAGEKAAAVKGKAGRTKQQAGSVVRKTNKAGAVYFRAMNTVSLSTNMKVSDFDGDEAAAEAAADKFAEGKAKKIAPKRRKKAEKAVVIEETVVIEEVEEEEEEEEEEDDWSDDELAAMLSDAGEE